MYHDEIPPLKEISVKITNVLERLQFAGQAEGDRRTYFAFQGDGPYVIASPNDRGGFNVNIIEREVPYVVARQFGGQRVTSGILVKQGRRPDLFGAPFSALNALYLMVAIGRARKLKERDGRALVFKIGKEIPEKPKRKTRPHFQVTVFYKDGERFARVYNDQAKAIRFAARQRKSPVVRHVRTLPV